MSGNHNHHVRWSQQERDLHRGTEQRSIRRDVKLIRKSVSIPADIAERVFGLQEQFMQDQGLSLSFSAALASLVRSAPAWPTR